MHHTRQETIVTPGNAIIIGAGLNGLLTARECAAAGLQVTLLDRQGQMRPASWAAGGILSPLEPWREPDAALALARAGQRIYPALVEALSGETGIDMGYTDSGMLFLEPADSAEIIYWAERNEQPWQLLEAVELARLEPALRREFSSGLKLSGIHQIRNPRLMKALLQSLQRAGIEIVSTGCIELLIREDQCQGVVVDGITYPADCVVVAAGAWSSRLLEDLEPSLPVKPMRGQMIAYQAPPDTLSHIVLHQRRYLVPRQDGLILAGSTVEDAGFDTGTTPAAARDLHETATGLLPVLAGLAPEYHWSGLRPATADGLPFVGSHPTARGLYVNYGHFRNGVLQAPASARLLADIMLGRPCLLPPGPYSPERLI